MVMFWYYETHVVFKECSNNFTQAATLIQSWDRVTVFWKIAGSAPEINLEIIIDMLSVAQSSAFTFL